MAWSLRHFGNRNGAVERFLCQLVQCIIYIDGIINRRDVFPVVLDKSWRGGGLGIVADVNNLALGEDGPCDIGRGGLFPGSKLKYEANLLKTSRS